MTPNRTQMTRSKKYPAYGLPISTASPKFSFVSLYSPPFSRYSTFYYIPLTLMLNFEKYKLPEVAQILSFYARGLKFSLFSLYRQLFLRYRPIFKIAIFGHETWPLAKVPEVAHILFFYPDGVKIELIFPLKAAVSEIQADFQNCHIEHETTYMYKKFVRKYQDKARFPSLCLASENALFAFALCIICIILSCAIFLLKKTRP